MRFSILIPVYNVEKYLPECLDSVVNQSFKDFEIICVNDGSTDKSLDLLENYQKKDQRIRIKNKNNQGLLWARRDAIKLAKGDYCLFIDSDDKYHDLDVLMRIDNCLTKYNDPDLLLFDRAEIIDDKIVYTCPHFYESERFFERENINELRYNFICRNYLNAIFLKCVKTEILHNDKTDYSVYNPQMAEDITQSMYIFDKCKTVAFLPDFIYLYRNNNESITRAPLTIDILETKMVRKLFFELYMLIEKWQLKFYKNDVLKLFLRKAYSFYYDRVVELCSNKENKPLMIEIMNFNWFNAENDFLKDELNISKAKLSNAKYNIIQGLCKKDERLLRKGINLVKMQQKWNEFLSFLRGNANE